ncbi:endonuclease/exonuclease/phosphatase family protein [Streptomyces kronopolitis]|uniref:endonuclease/exonuclease/phosphatase family protein n=1 Tax=Streptomyces kronopolitis TaxID=1612435 RepID=UPI003D97E672
MQITILCWNLEHNGGSHIARFQAHERLRSLNPHLVLRQEMWGSDADGQRILYELESILGMRGWLGPRSSTAIFTDPAVFQPVRTWDTGPMWVQPPTALTLRYRPAPVDSMPLAVASYHLNYASPTNRMAEAEWLSTWADKYQTAVDGEAYRLPALLGGDTNSYPEPGLPKDPALPKLDEIQDRPHRLHRSYVGPDGRRRMDTRPDEALRTAGLEDVARYWSTASGGCAAAVARTVNGCASHGPDARVDRIYATGDLLPAVLDVDVIEVPLTESDHHIVRLELDGDVLTDILARPVSAMLPAA